MKFYFLIFISIIFFNCSESKKIRPISFEVYSDNQDKGIIVAFTNDSDSLWLKEEWVKEIRNKMENLSSKYSTILLFNAINHTPDVTTSGMDYPTNYDQYMVCGYWVFPDGKKEYCYGGVKSDGNFKECE